MTPLGVLLLTGTHILAVLAGAWAASLAEWIAPELRGEE